MCLKACKRAHPSSIKTEEEDSKAHRRALPRGGRSKETPPRTAFPIHPRTSISVCRAYSISPQAAFLIYPRTLKKCIRITAKISVCSFWMHIRSLWMAIRSLWMAIRRLQTEISVSCGGNCCMLRGGLQHAM